MMIIGYDFQDQVTQVADDGRQFPEKAPFLFPAQPRQFPGCQGDRGGNRGSECGDLPGDPSVDNHPQQKAQNKHAVILPNRCGMMPL